MFVNIFGGHKKTKNNFKPLNTTIQVNIAKAWTTNIFSF